MNEVGIRMSRCFRGKFFTINQFKQKTPSSGEFTHNLFTNDMILEQQTVVTQKNIQKINLSTIKGVYYV
jgi:hypothetical protein